MVQEIVITTKQAYYNTPIKFLSQLHRDGWSVNEVDGEMVFVR